jgi:hypothetical protein
MKKETEMGAVMERPAAVPAVASNATSLLQAITQAASNPNVDIDKMERLWAMHEQMVKREAEAAFNDAMTACQSEMRAVATDADNPQTHSRYATYARLDAKLRQIYTRNGFAISYSTDDSPKEEHVRVLAYVSRGGHTRLYRVDMPADGKGAKGGDVMTKTHAAGAAIAYGMRYLLKAIFNVAVGEEDKDGNDRTAGISEDRFQALKKLIETTTTKEAAKKVWSVGVQECEKVRDIATAERLKEVLIAHAKFIDEAAKAK